MKLQTTLCIALGIPVRVMEPMDVYLAGGKIIQAMPAGDRIQAIEEMTPAERRDLRERVERTI